MRIIVTIVISLLCATAAGAQDYAAQIAEMRRDNPTLFATDANARAWGERYVAVAVVVQAVPTVEGHHGRGRRLRRDRGQRLQGAG